MKFAFTFTLVLIINSAISQSLSIPATFTLYEYSTCDDTFKLSTYFTLSGKNGTLFPDSLGVINILVPGEYRLKHPSADLPWRGKKISISGSITDTVELAPIHSVAKSQGIGPTSYHYVNCNEICNGKEISFWANGDIRQKGIFKDGQIKKYRKYYASGSLNIKMKNKFLIDYGYFYDESGKLLVKQ